MRTIVCEIQSKVIPNFFSNVPSRNIRSKKRDHSIPEICLLFRSSNHSISRRDISTFKSLLVHLFYIYSRPRYVHFYICVCVKIHLSFCSSVAQLFRSLSKGYNFIPSRCYSFNIILNIFRRYKPLQNA